MSKYIFLIDSRGLIKSQRDDSQNRHKRYAMQLHSLEPDCIFHVISASDKNQTDEWDRTFQQSYIKCNSRFSFKFIMKSIAIIRKANPSNAILISGDPWEPTLSALLIAYVSRRLHGRNYSIQIQIHAEITDENWRKASYVNRFRYQVAKLTLKKAAQIRVVSNKLKNELSIRFSTVPERIFVAPVELNLTEEHFISSFKNRPRAIGFAGRFHRDRAVFELVDYLRKLEPDKNNLNVVLAGEGELLNETLAKISEFLPANRLDYCGNLSASEMLDFWKKIGVYVSFAKSESYGRAIREAAFFGVPVLGAKSNGFHLIEKMDVSWIREVKIEASPEELLSQVESMLRMETSDSVRLKLRDDSNASTKILLESWISLLNQ